MSYRIIRIKPEGITFGLTGIEARGWPCPYCAVIMTNGWDVRETLATTDHVLPLSRGGPNVRDNFLAVCSRCNGDKSNLTPFEWAGILLCDKDRRFQHVSNLIEIIAEHGDYDDKVRAEMYADMGRGYLMGKRGIRVWNEPPRRKRFQIPKFVETDAERAARESADIERRARIAETALYTRLRIPRSHWIFQPPDKVRVLLGSISETFNVFDADLLATEIATHPRYGYLRMRQAAE